MRVHSKIILYEPHPKLGWSQGYFPQQGSKMALQAEAHSNEMAAFSSYFTLLEAVGNLQGAAGQLLLNHWGRCGLSDSISLYLP